MICGWMYLSVKKVAVKKKPVKKVAVKKKPIKKAVVKKKATNKTGIKAKVENMVSAITLDQKIDLKKFAKKATGLESSSPCTQGKP